MNVLAKIVAAVSMVLLACGGALAVRGPQGVEYTVHNLSANMGGIANPNFQYATNEEEICIFCHTPHGGTLDGPLWNRSLPGAASFTHYNSATLTTAAGDTTRPVSKESLLCLSCHDGSIATNRIINPNNSNPNGQPLPNWGSDVYVAGGFGTAGPRIGASNADTGATGDLSDDHPISFSYYDAYTEESGQPDGGGLRAPADALTRGVRFFGAGATSGGMRVECSSCHDPHVSYDDYWATTSGLSYTFDTKYDPFLITPNTGSALCLACHVK